ncbi:hypothetical protein [Catenovulum agarivorans]|uniref:hypothetical protein n=1 Tax=Catenovulum agarivorans TaxID=1172192 RepID=UPI0002D64A91|nr:hypothetical protein [Catenovulum agarivorans]
MELSIFLYWLLLFSAFLGWYAHHIDQKRLECRSDILWHFAPRFLLFFQVASVVLIAIFALLSILKANKWLILFLFTGAVLCITYFYFKYSLVSSKLFKSLFVKFVVISLGISITFYCSIEIATYMARLTKTPSGTFSIFEHLLVIVYSSVMWVAVLQALMMPLALFLQYKLAKDDLPNSDVILAICTILLLVGIVCKFFAGFIVVDVMPELVDNYFVRWMYHPNTDPDGVSVLCNNVLLDKDSQIVLLPANEVSVAIQDQGKWNFSTLVCNL